MSAMSVDNLDGGRVRARPIWRGSMHTHYEPPEVVDYGSLTELTAALSVNGTEDGGSKAVPLHHSAPAQP